MKLGAQLFTVRDYCKDTQSLSETLKRVADIGYTTVQVSGTCKYDPVWLSNELKRNGLQCAITHIGIDTLCAEPEAVVKSHRIFGCNYPGIGYYEIEKNGGSKAFYEKLIYTAQVIASNGMLLMYHNHDQEFAHEDGVTILRRICDLFSSKLLGITLDTFWVQAGGGDPIAWIRELSSRTPCVHLKDMNYSQKMAPVGEGNMNFQGILSACDDAGVEYVLVEQDHCYDDDPFDCLRRSYEYLKAQGIQ